MFENVERFLENSAHEVPLELFVPIGGLIEEIIAPIPSVLVGTTAGSIAALQAKPVIFLALLALLIAFGKTLGSLFWYFLADKLEDVLLPKFGRLLGVSHKEIESIGRHFNGGIRDELIIFLFRAIPAIPGPPVAVACGFFKIKLRSFIIATYLGYAVRDSMFIYFGHAGLSTFAGILHGINKTESLLQGLIVLIIAGVLIWLYARRAKFKN